jgi:hypothetical protein
MLELPVTALGDDQNPAVRFELLQHIPNLHAAHEVETPVNAAPRGCVFTQIPARPSQNPPSSAVLDPGTLMAGMGSCSVANLSPRPSLRNDGERGAQTRGWSGLEPSPQRGEGGLRSRPEGFSHERFAAPEPHTWFAAGF